jgi:hypothetical protein
VTGWRIIAALTWLTAMGIFAAALQRSVPAPARLPYGPATSALARSLNDSRPDGMAVRWAVVSAAAAQHAMVMDVEAIDVSDALRISVTIVEPVREKYGEVLVYFRKAGERHTVRRVQWTPAAGYVELVYAPAP